VLSLRDSEYRNLVLKNSYKKRRKEEALHHPSSEKKRTRQRCSGGNNRVSFLPSNVGEKNRYGIGSGGGGGERKNLRAFLSA